MATKKATNKGFAVDLEELLEAGAHFGHQVKRWNPKMAKYIWGKRGGVHIFDLAKTALGLEEAAKFLQQAASEGKSIVMVGTKRQAAQIVKEEAVKAGVYFVSERWLGGGLTNWDQIKKRLNNLTEMKRKREAGEYDKYTKRERVLLDREIARSERFFGGLEGLTDRPEIMFVVDTQRERVAVKEAKAKGLIVVAVVDSNSDPDLVDYVIPANDDAVRSIKLIVETIGRALKEGRGEWQKKAVKEEKKVK